jgi:hypothetical protein
MTSVETDEYGNNLIIAHAEVEAQPGVTNGSYGSYELAQEVQEVILGTSCPEITEWAFPRHHRAALHVFRLYLTHKLTGRS